MTSNRIWFATRRDPLDQTVRSMVSQLLEMGLPFVFDADQQLPGDLPESAAEAGTLLLDDPLIEQVDQAQLERYKQSGGRIFRAVELLGEVEGQNREQLGLTGRMVIDGSTHNTAHVLARHAEIKPDWQALRQLQARIKPEDMVEPLVQNAEDWCNRLARFQEKAYQYWTVTRVLIEAGYDHLTPVLGQSMEKSLENTPEVSYHSDCAGGLHQVLWYAQREGRDDLLEKAVKLSRELQRRRPRNGDMLAATGLIDDPIGRTTTDPLDFRLAVDAYTNIIWTETVRVHGGVFAAMAGLTGESVFEDECRAIIDRLETSHLRSDGLLAHTSHPDQTHATDQQPVWARGVGHACYGLLSILEGLPADSPLRERVHQLLRKILKGLIPHQDSDTGLWRNLIDYPDARLETSGTISFVCVLYQGLKAGWLEEDVFGPVAEKAFDGIWLTHWHGGLGASCRGTASSPYPIYYLARPQGWAPEPYVIMGILLRQAYLNG